MVELVAIQENPGRSELGYEGAAKKGKPRRKTQGKQEIRPNLYHYFIRREIISPKQVAMIEDQPSGLVEWINPMARELDNWTTEALPDLVPWKIPTLVLDVTGESSRHNEGENSEEEALIELERPRLQSGTEELETINIGEGEETKDIRKLVALLREYSNIFAWYYRDMPGLDTTIVEHKLPLIPNVRQQLRRMKPKMVLKIKEEVEK
ncbi:hypothetical protein CR513_10476, partial [Mucuna pruriens]